MSTKKPRQEDLKDKETHQVADGRPLEPEEYLHSWELVKETEGLDDEEIVKEYAKIFSEDTSSSNNKGNK